MLELVSLRARPDLMAQVFSGPMQAAWPEFMQHDTTAQLYFGRPHLDACLDTAFAVVDPARPEVAVGRAFAVPFAFDDVPGRTELPDSGWDGVIRWAHQDRALGRPADALSALDITLAAVAPRAGRVPHRPRRAPRACGRPGLPSHVRAGAAHGEAPRPLHADGRVRRAIDPCRRRGRGGAPSAGQARATAVVRSRPDKGRGSPG